MEHALQFIGKIQSRLKTLEECPLQENEDAPEAEVVIFPEFLKGIQDIKVGSEVVILTWLHRADRTVLQTKPRNNPEAALTGVFSTRSPDRPNPIGLHVAKVLSVSANSFKVSGLEVLDQTPLLDIKPVWNNNSTNLR